MVVVEVHLGPWLVVPIHDTCWIARLAGSVRGVGASRVLQVAALLF